MGCTALLCLVVTITVFSRWLYKPIIPDDVLIVRELMVAIILLPLASVTAARAHIAVTVFTNWLGGLCKIVLSALGHFTGLVLVTGLIWAGGRLFWSSWKSGDYFDGNIYIPAWIGYAVFLLALMAFAIRLAVQFMSDMLRSFKG